MRPCKVPSGPGRRTGLVWSGASRGGAEADSGWAPAALGVPSSSTVALGKGGSQTSAPPAHQGGWRSPGELPYPAWLALPGRWVSRLGAPARQAGRRESRVAAGGPGLGGEWETKGTITALFCLQGAARGGPAPSAGSSLPASRTASPSRPKPAAISLATAGPARSRPAGRTLPQAGLHRRSGSPRGGALRLGSRLQPWP